MARQKGHIKYVGTLGEVRHFKIKNNPGYYAGLKGGPTGEQIASDPAFVRTRENMNEFGGSATAGRSFRTSIANLIRNSADSRVTGRITAVMKKINLEDGSEARGQRAILVTAAPQYLDGFEFNKFNSFSGVFNAPYSITPSVERDESDLSIPVFNPLDNMFIPAGATHFKIINAIFTLPYYIIICSCFYIIRAKQRLINYLERITNFIYIIKWTIIFCNIGYDFKFWFQEVQ